MAGPQGRPRVLRLHGHSAAPDAATLSGADSAATNSGTGTPTFADERLPVNHAILERRPTYAPLNCSSASPLIARATFSAPVDDRQKRRARSFSMDREKG